MTLWDAFLAVIHAIGVFTTSPFIVFLCGGFMTVCGLPAFVLAFSDLNLHWFKAEALERALWVLAGLAAVVFGLSLIVWALHSVSPFAWVAR